MRRRNDGVALVTALAVLVVVALVAAGVFFTTRVELMVTRNDSTSAQANYVAQAGLQRYKAALFQYYRWLESDASQASNPDRTACFNRLSYGLDFERDLSNGTQYTWDGNNSIGPFNGSVTEAGTSAVIGDYVVTLFRDPNNNNVYSIRSIGTSHGARSTARATFSIQNTGILEQAIFSGSGQANKSINGGATVRGGVYVVGSSGQTVIDANGNFSLLNDYDLSDYGFANGVQVGQYVSSANRTVDNLCATLRVEQGQVALGGSTVLGQPDNKLLGVYVSGGTGDIEYKGNFLDTCTQTKGVCTDDLGKFNLSDPPDFPTFDGKPDPNECTIAGADWRTCIHADAVSGGLRIVHGEAISLPSEASQSSDFGSCTTALTSTAVTFDAATVDCTYSLNGRTYGFKYDASTSPARFYVYGSVDLDGFDVSFDQSTEYVARSYRSENGVSYTTVNNASFVVEDSAGSYGNLDLNQDLVPYTAGGSSADQYPNHVLGLIAEHNVYQRGQYVMAPVYAGDIYRTVKDNVLFGSIISDEFCTTSAGSKNDCTAGQKAEVVYINTANNKPALLRQISPKAGIATFAVDSYELK